MVDYRERSRVALPAACQIVNTGQTAFFQNHGVWERELAICHELTSIAQAAQS
jgi:hypothetical protein